MELRRQKVLYSHRNEMACYGLHFAGRNLYYYQNVLAEGKTYLTVAKVTQVMLSELELTDHGRKVKGKPVRKAN